MVLFDFKSDKHFVTSSDKTTLKVYELTNPNIHPSSVRKTHWREVANINGGNNDDDSGADQQYCFDGLSFFDGHGKIEVEDAITKLAQHLTRLGLMVSPGGYCFQDVTELGEHKEFGVHYLRLNDLFDWPRHGVDLARITTWRRLELKFATPSREKVPTSKEKYEKLKRAAREKDEELEKVKEEMEGEVQKVRDGKDEEIRKLKEEMENASEKQEEDLETLRKEKNEELRKLLKKKDEELKTLKRANDEGRVQVQREMRTEKTKELRKMREEMEEAIGKVVKEKDEEVGNLEEKEAEALRKLRAKDEELERLRKSLEEKEVTGDGAKLREEKDEEMEKLRRELKHEKEKMMEECRAETGKLRDQLLQHELEQHRPKKGRSWAVLPTTKFLTGGFTVQKTRSRPVPWGNFCPTEDPKQGLYHYQSVDGKGDTWFPLINSLKVVDDDEDNRHKDWPLPPKIHLTYMHYSLDQDNWWFVKTTHPDGGLTMLAYYDGCQTRLPSYLNDIRLPFPRSTYFCTDVPFFLISVAGAFKLAFMYRD